MFTCALVFINANAFICQPTPYSDRLHNMYDMNMRYTERLRKQTWKTYTFSTTHTHTNPHDNPAQCSSSYSTCIFFFFFFADFEFFFCLFAWSTSCLAWLLQPVWVCFCAEAAVHNKHYHYDSFPNSKWCWLRTNAKRTRIKLYDI